MLEGTSPDAFGRLKNMRAFVENSRDENVRELVAAIYFPTEADRKVVRTPSESGPQATRFHF